MERAAGHGLVSALGSGPGLDTVVDFSCLA